MTTAGFLDTMRRGLTPVYSRGMERLDLAFGTTDIDGTTHIATYDFTAYANLYDGRQPDSPRYLLAPGQAAGEPRTVRVWFKPDPNGPEAPPVDVLVPAGWQAGRGIAVPLPGHAADLTAGLRLTRFQPRLPASQHAADWAVVALLGNLAKLLWVVGWEHEELRWQLADAAAQRTAAAAHGASLDLLGRDLGVPRFPATPYTWDPDTLALYHLDDLPVPPQAEVVTVADDRSRYQATGHPGQNNGGHSGRRGRFGRAFEFRENQTSITVPDDPEFALPAGSSFTAEAVVKPDRTVTATGAVIAKRAQLNTAGDAGWALTLGSFRGIDRNVRLSLSDGSTEVELFADRDLGDGVFHHVAGVVEHRAGPPAVTLGRLYLDGVAVDSARLDPLGALTSGQAISIGYGREVVGNVPTDAQFVGLIDEVRVSKVARAAFNPVVGEGDDQYRRRLGIFQRWVVPTPDALQAAINEIANPVANDPAPFVVDETVEPTAIGTLALRVLPAALAPGQCVAADGDLRSSEAAAVGIAADDDFDPAWLRRHEDRAGLDFAGVEANRLMQWVVRQALDALLGRLAATAGTLHVLRAFDATATDLHGVGRALLLTHDAIGPADLAVHAHAAGFGWVCHTGKGQVHVAQPAGEAFRITPPLSGQEPQPPDVVEGQDLDLGLDPDVLGLSLGSTRIADAAATWSLVHCGFGDADLVSSPKPRLHARAAGDIAVHLEVTRRRHTAGGSRLIRIGLDDNGLAAGASIAGDGRRGVTEADAAGTAEDGFSELYLVTRVDDYTGQHPNVSYGTDLANRRMQRVTARRLDGLLDLLGGTPGTLAVVKAFDPAGSGLVTQGRALWLRHSSLPLPALAARAFAAGFDYVRIDPGPPGTLQVAVAAGEPISITGANEVQVGSSIPLAVDPLAAPAAVCFSADGGRAYVADQGGARVTSFALTANPANAFPRIAFDRSAAVPPTPIAIAFGGGHVYVAHRLPGTISVLDPATLAPVTAVATGPAPVALAADGDRLFVGCSGNRTLRAIDVQSNLQVGSVVLPDVPVAIAPIPGGASLYVVIAGSRFCQVDRTSLTLMGAPIATGTGARSAVVTPDGKKLYVACAADDPANQTGTVRSYTTSTNAPATVVHGFPPHTPPAMVAISADQTHLFVATSGANGISGRVHVVLPAGDTLIDQVFTPGSTSTWLATSPAAATYQPCLLAVSADAGTVTVADTAPLALVPPRPPRVAATVTLGSGGGERPAWATVPFSRGRGELSSLTRPFTRLKGLAPGAALVRAIYLRGDGLLPYQFSVHLNTALEGQAGVTIRKDQYDLVMNVLNWFCPLGVEARTDRLRAHVVELSDLGDLFPGYTYPVYHHAGLTLPPTTATSEG